MAAVHPIPADRRFDNLTGLRFGRLVVISYAGPNPSRSAALWHCVCECGKKTRPAGSKLRSGHTTSCGCFGRELRRDRATVHGFAGTARIPEYNVWRTMKSRCLCKTNKQYADYGGRGITVCVRWLTFESFLADMGRRPSAKHQIDRIDNNGSYCPENCRWATAVQQARNGRANRLLTFNGRTQCAAAWAEEIGIPPVTFRQRLRLGMEPPRLFTKGHLARGPKPGIKRG